jgi:two-component system response regulator AtoC
MQSQNDKHRILVEEDELEVRAYLEMALKYFGYSVELAQDGEEILGLLRSASPPVSAVLLDLASPHSDGIDVLRQIRLLDLTLPVIVMSATASTLDVVTAMKTGATDFLCKPVEHEDLRSALARALEVRTSTEPAAAAPPQPAKSRRFVGTNARMREIQALTAHLGWSEAPVLIQGETGSGKEVLARDLHANSPRADKVFLKLNCAALPSELVESELFGYERGAFTGAFQKKSGMFELADGGTILLDEIGDMDIRLQAKLLQVLQDREFQRIGGKDVIRVDVRVIAATHRNLETAITEGTFREDLYYRLNVVDIHLPPLRECKEDIAPMAEYLLTKHAAPGNTVPITPELKQAMMMYQWPGNVRELENIVRRLIVLRDPDLLAKDLYSKAARKPAGASPLAVSSPSPAIPSAGAGSGAAPILEQVTKAQQQAESEAILAALHFTRWNRKQAAALLKIDYKALLYKMKKLGVENHVPSPSGERMASTGD